MRNLQKILALVLALVNEPLAHGHRRRYRLLRRRGDRRNLPESVDVLNGLKVFQGYDNGAYFSPRETSPALRSSRHRSTRIATGDVSDSQVKIYADYNKFSDVPLTTGCRLHQLLHQCRVHQGPRRWEFYPSDKVTGYEALAMILRVVGYDKNGEFTGADWQVQTAATANQRKVTKNVNAGTLGTPATRETVAELLCQAILIEKVNHPGLRLPDQH